MCVCDGKVQKLSGTLCHLILQYDVDKHTKRGLGSFGNLVQRVVNQDNKLKHKQRKVQKTKKSKKKVKHTRAQLEATGAHRDPCNFFTQI